MNISILFLAALLFFLLTPNVLLRLPKNGNKYMVAGVHAVVFAVTLYLGHMLMRHMNLMRDGFTNEDCTTGTNEDEGEYMLDEQGNCKKRDPPVSPVS
jgi:hypothetical protein